MTPCVWYVSEFKTPWEGAVIANLAAVLRAAGFPIRVFVEGGTANVRMDGVFSWHSLPFYERVMTVAFKGKLWHLWGKAPFWWGLVRLRARTVHTSLDSETLWKGHPTRLFADQADEGESLLRPTFDVKVAWAGDDFFEETPSMLVAEFEPGKVLEKALERSGFPFLSLKSSPKGAKVAAALKKSRVLVTDDAPSNLLLAAYMTLQGVPVVARASSRITSLLGKEGYVSVEKDEDEAWVTAFKQASSELGRSASASARRFLTSHFAAADSVESVSALYRSVTEGKV